MKIIERAKGIILKPSATWSEIKEEQVTIGELYKSYAVILAAIPAIAQFIRNAFIGYSFMGASFKIDIGTSFGSALSSYILSLAGIYISALIANTLAPSFGSRKNIINAFKAVIYSMTPVWIAGIFYIIPSLSFLVFLASLYGIYLFYLGLPSLMDTPKEKSIRYVIVVIVVTIVVNIAIGAIAGAMFLPKL